MSRRWQREGEAGGAHVMGRREGDGEAVVQGIGRGRGKGERRGLGKRDRGKEGGGRGYEVGEKEGEGERGMRERGWESSDKRYGLREMERG